MRVQNIGGVPTRDNPRGTKGLTCRSTHRFHVSTLSRGGLHVLALLDVARPVVLGPSPILGPGYCLRAVEKKRCAWPMRCLLEAQAALKLPCVVIHVYAFSLLYLVVPHPGLATPVKNRNLSRLIANLSRRNWSSECTVLIVFQHLLCLLVYPIIFPV